MFWNPILDVVVKSLCMLAVLIGKQSPMDYLPLKAIATVVCCIPINLVCRCVCLCLSDSLMCVLVCLLLSINAWCACASAGAERLLQLAEVKPDVVAQDVIDMVAAYDENQDDHDIAQDEAILLHGDVGEDLSLASKSVVRKAKASAKISDAEDHNDDEDDDADVDDVHIAKEIKKRGFNTPAPPMKHLLQTPGNIYADRWTKEVQAGWLCIVIRV